jgi:hypothetical protein
VNNDRIIYGDDADAEGGKYGFHPEAQNGYDEYLLRVMRERREGKLSF